MPDLRIGISGWRYEPWRGTFYPKDLVQKRELEFASRKLNSIEINGTFYSLQRPGSFQSWYEQTPEDFVFAVKGPRFITHMKRLKDVRVPLANFLASGVLLLKKKLGPILWQFPPNFLFDEERFEAFFGLLPRDTRSAAKLAGEHSEQMNGRSYVKTDANRPLRHAVEIRHESFRAPAFVKLLERQKIALVFADTAGRWPDMEDITADFIYCRLHGDKELYVSGYTDEALDEWAKRIGRWQGGRGPAKRRGASSSSAARADGRDVYVYFDNDVKVRSPFDAMNLYARLTGGERVEPIKASGSAATGPRARTHWPGVGKKGRRVAG